MHSPPHFGPCHPVAGKDFVVPTLVAACMLGMPGLAVSDEPANGGGGRSAATELQATTEAAVRTVCPQLAQREERTAPQDDLFSRCREMVQTRNALEGEGPSAFDLDLDEAALNAAFQQIAAEETVAPGTMVTEFSGIQAAAVLGRLGALQATGVGLADAGGQGRDDMPVLLASTNDTLTMGLASGGSQFDGGWSRLGAFANATFGFGDRDATQRENGFDFDTVGLTAGADYRLSTELVLGGALGYTRLNADFQESAEVAGGKVEGDSWSLLGYALYNVGDFYAHGLLGYSRTDFDIERRIDYEPGPNAGPQVEGADRTARADPDGRQFQVSAGFGYELRRNAWSLSPGVRVEILRARIDGYRERGAEGLDMAVQRQTVESATTALGAELAYTSGQPFGVLIPQARAEWVHEFSNHARRIETRYANDPEGTVLAVRTDDPDRNYLRLGASVSAVFRGGTQAFIDYETLQLLNDVESHQFTAGIRLEF